MLVDLVLVVCFLIKSNALCDWNFYHAPAPSLFAWDKSSLPEEENKSAGALLSCTLRVFVIAQDSFVILGPYKSD